MKKRKEKERIKTKKGVIERIEEKCYTNIKKVKITKKIIIIFFVSPFK